MKAAIIIMVVLAVLIGGLLTLRRTRDAGMPDQATLSRAKDRAREQASKDEERDR